MILRVHRKVFEITAFPNKLVLCWSKFLLVCSTRTFFAARLPAVDHHRQGIIGLVPHRVHAALRLYLATRPRAPFERPGITLEELLP